MEEANGAEALKYTGTNKKWTGEARYELVAQVLAGSSVRGVAISHGIDSGLLYRWVQKYKLEGYEGLVTSSKGRPTKEPSMKKKAEPKELNESEREELVRLRAENAYIKAENEIIKKEIALREQKWDEQLKAKKQRSSKNSGKKDIR